LQRLDVNRKLAGFRDEEITGDAYEIAVIEQVE
jgi:hypothetical protein